MPGHDLGFAECFSDVSNATSEIGDGARILPHQIVERFVRRADGELEPLTEEITGPIASTVTHAGIRQDEAVQYRSSLYGSRYF
jgi:hypothetical protein